VLLPKNALIAVADGERLVLFKNSGDEAKPTLTMLQAPDMDGDNKGSGGRHHSSSANPDDSQQNEDGFAAGVSEMLNKQMLAGNFDHLVVIAAPRTLGELRKHYHKALASKLIGEIAKDLTGHSAGDIQAAIAAA